jgi:adenylosuccinate synthase
MRLSRATIIIGLGYGDCGKGSIVDYLACNRDVRTVVRFNGGPQAGHNVVTPDGRHHTFSQFGSGTLARPGVGTFLSRFMLIEPYSMLNEAVHLQQLGCDDIWERLSIDARCVVITPVHQAVNRLRELLRGPTAHGTCGLGVGEATADDLVHPELTLHAGDFAHADVVAGKLLRIIEFKAHQLRLVLAKLRHNPEAQADLATILYPSWVSVAVDACCAVGKAARIVPVEIANQILTWPGEILFEGAQGVLLDKDFGFHPHTTWSATTTANAMQLLKEAGAEELPRRIGVLRSYMTRHGAGPFVTEDSSLLVDLPEPHNDDFGRQGPFRVGVFDAVAARYAVSVAGVDELAITHLDRLPVLPSCICTDYKGPQVRLHPQPIRSDDLRARQEQTRMLAQWKPSYQPIPGPGEEAFLQAVGRQLHMPIHLLSFGPTAADKKIRA